MENVKNLGQGKKPTKKSSSLAGRRRFWSQLPFAWSAPSEPPSSPALFLFLGFRWNLEEKTWSKMLSNPKSLAYCSIITVFWIKSTMFLQILKIIHADTLPWYLHFLRWDSWEWLWDEGSEEGDRSNSLTINNWTYHHLRLNILVNFLYHLYRPGLR